MIRAKSTLERPSPACLALFQKRFDGDDAMLALARARFERIGLGAEVYAESVDELRRTLAYAPARLPVFAHLPRAFDLLAPGASEALVDMVSAAPVRLSGLVVHDQREAESQLPDYVRALRILDDVLSDRAPGLTLYVEYACGLALDRYVAVFDAVRHLAGVSACVDVGHVGMREARAAFARLHGGMDPCSLHADHPSLPSLVRDVQSAVGAGRDAALELVGRIAQIGKPLHLHLHDAHPLAKSPQWGLSDHRSFLEPIPIGFEWRGRTSLDSMFGPHGLYCIVEESLAARDPSLVSMTIEIHPGEGQTPLGREASLFEHWRDRAPAERMSCWLDCLVQHAVLLDAACEAAIRSDKVASSDTD